MKHNNTLIDQNFDTLTKSPLFNLSLANKELFHSNFIAWFGTMYPSYFISLINNISNPQTSLNFNNIDIRREWNHFDISVFENKSSKTPLLIIENKVKSVPTKAQLDQYNERIEKINKDCIRILLTMNKQLQNGEDITSKWTIVNYNTLSEKLNQVTSNAQITNTYHEALIKDYSTYIIALEKTINEVADNKLLFYKLDKLQKLGIHDICGKRKMQEVYNIVSEKLNDLKNNLTFKWDYTDEALFEVKFKGRNNDDVILIQIQGKQYRHCVEFFDKKIGVRITNRYNNKEEKFGPNSNGIQYLQKNYNNILFSEDALNKYPDKLKNNEEIKEFGNNGGINGYCKYCNGKPNKDNKFSCFVYQWVKIPDKMSINDLAEIIEQDTRNLYNIINPTKPN
ncbi:MAG: PD-(D/E)XK nuclease family protein [Paludibacteraceae bacterium]|nr:PD-(D/E)XK nuclease family protein [Paludibacteraceae bacterium]